MSIDVYGEKGGKGGGGDARTPREAPNTLRSGSVARIVDLLGEGPIVGLANGLQSVFFDDTPLQNDDGSYNFQGVTVHAREGYAEQDYIPGFPGAEAEQDVSAELLHDTPLVRTIANPDVDAARIKIQVSALTYQDPKTGDIKGTSVAIAIDIRSSGGAWVETRRDTISGKTTSPYQRAYRIDLPGAGPWDLRVRRLTADSEKSNLRNQTFWTAYTEVIDAKLQYPDTALIGLAIDAQPFGNQIPSRSYDVMGLIVRVPSNYDPATRTYSGLWDGSFKLAWSDNPAWCFLDLATSERYGAGLESVDKWALYQIAQYCDELVPNGYGADEPRFTFNTVLASREEAISALNTLASAFRGMTYWGANTVMAVADMPGDPVKLVTPANVVEGEFEYSGTALKARHSVALVSWNDPGDNYRLQVEVIEDAEAIQQFGWKQLDVNAVGCTSRGQAHRLGEWMLASERAETETVTYAAGVDHADVRPGDLIALSDPTTAGARLGGRIVVTGLDSLELDAVPESASGSDWYLDVLLPTGGIERREVASFVRNRVTLLNPLSAEPITGAVWLLSSQSVEPRQFRVLSVAEQEAGIYAITALEHDPTKYDRIEQGLALAEPDYSLIPTGPLPAPVSLSVVEYLYRAGPSVRSAISVSIQPPSDARVTLFEGQVQAPGQPGFAPAHYGSALTFALENTEPGAYVIRARSISGTGRLSPWREETFAIQGLLAPPSNVSDLRIAVNAGQLLLSWPAVQDLDLSHYRVRYNALTVGATWSSSQDLAPEVAAGTTQLALPSRRGTYLVKAVDSSGAESRDAVLAVSEVAEIAALNVVEVVDEGPAWDGMRQDVLASSGMLQLGSADPIDSWESLTDVLNLTYGVSGVASEGIYIAAETVDLGHIYTARLTGEVLATGYDILGVITAWNPLAGVEQLDMSDVSQWDVRLDVSYSVTPAPDAPSDWSPWEPLHVGEYTARAFRFRLRLHSYAPAITPLIRSMGITVDMPDRIAAGQDITCPPEGMRVEYDAAFMARPSLAVDAQGLSTGDYKAITNRDAAGFDLRFFDAGGSGVSRSFDYLAKGYGRRAA